MVKIRRISEMEDSNCKFFRVMKLSPCLSYLLFVESLTFCLFVSLFVCFGWGVVLAIFCLFVFKFSASQLFALTIYTENLLWPQWPLSLLLYLYLSRTNYYNNVVSKLQEVCKVIFFFSVKHTLYFYLLKNFLWRNL